jgi:methyl-accepting chemotaxis protein
MKLSNVSVAAKLWMALGCVIVMLLITLFMAIARGNSLNAKLDGVAAEQVERAETIAHWSGLTQTNITRITDSLLSSDPAVDALYKEKIPATLQQIGELGRKIDAMDLTPESKTLLTRIREEGKTVLQSYAKLGETKKSGDHAAVVSELNASFLPAATKYANSLNEIAELQRKEAASLHDNFLAIRQADSWFAKTMVGILIALLAVGTWLLIQQIRQPLRDAILVAETIASGDLSAKVVVDRHDEFGEMLTAIANMQERLVRLVGDVRSGTDSMAHVSEEIAAGNHDLSMRTEQSAASLEETASSMQELTANVKHSADSARQANQLATSAAQVAQRGGDVVGQVVSTMNDINASSRKISDIISVIDGIAFQTNILALNAAVEAARAGEQGRGFAVVASEVRSLAGRSADAAKEIKQLINASVEKVEAGSTLVAQAGETMTEIVGSVQRVTDIMGGISTAAAEQSDGIAQVNAAVAQLDQMTQQNAALVEQSAAAASSMKDQARHLAELVATFKLGDSVVHSQPVAFQSIAPKKSPTKIAFAQTPKKLATPKRAAGTPAAKLPVPSKAPPALASKASGSKDDDDWETF